MPRKPRILSSTGIYHVILRSVNQHIIFEEDSDYFKFLYILSDCKMNYEIELYAYCLMDNHVHLLLKAPPDKFSTFFQSLGTRFARWYNDKYLRSGHLFQDRFYSTAVENDRAFLATLTYIHNNPTKANICRYPSEYQWSSYNAYYGKKNSLVDLTLACNIAGSRDALLHYFSRESDNSDNKLFENDHKEKRHFLSDENALAVFCDVTKLSSTSEVNDLNKTQRNEFIRMLRKRGLTSKQIARLMDVSSRTVDRLCQITH